MAAAATAGDAGLAGTGADLTGGASITSSLAYPTLRVVFFLFLPSAPVDTCCCAGPAGAAVLAAAGACAEPALLLV